MRLFIAATLAASLFTTDLLAAEASAPLPTGKPAGLKQAQLDSNTTILVAGGLVLAGVLAAVLSSNPSNITTTPVSTLTTSGTP
jgi:hypothetical protein